MSGTSDEAKGRIEEAAGDLTGDEELQQEGKVDQAAGKVKQKLDEAKDWAEDKIDDLKKK